MVHTGECEGFAGPQTLTMIELMEEYLAARGEQTPDPPRAASVGARKRR